MSAMQKQLMWLVLFSIAMGFLESAVVVYLRQLYYPSGFRFPLSIMDVHVFVTELLREAATLIMLVGVAILGASTPRQRFAFFLIAFAVWDIFYYVFLKVLLNWPESLLTWDILFLLPVPWVGPVLAPCIVSLNMTLLAVVILQGDIQLKPVKIGFLEWSLLGSGSLVLLLSWTWDYVIMFGPGIPTAEQSISFFGTYVPQYYNWWVFGLGELLLLSAIYLVYRRARP